MFDPDLARRVAHYFKLNTTFSSASLVASHFAAHATGSTRLFNLQFDGLSLDIHQVNVPAGEELADVCKRHDGKLVAAVDAAGYLRFDVASCEPFQPHSILILSHTSPDS
jgi:hypothetical protein